MIIDFHVHGKITSKFPFDEEKFILTINEAKENGLDSLALTEHCHSQNFLEGYEFLNANYNYINEYYDIDGFKVFYGMEVTTKQKLDILIIGRASHVVELRESIVSLLKDDKYIDILDLFKLDISDDLFIILAHPYRDYEIFPSLEKHVIDRIDAIELNAKDLYNQGMEEMQEKVLQLAKQLNLPVTAGSDTHHFMQMSTAKNILKKDCKTGKELREEIKSKNFKVEFSSDLKVRVKSAIIIKKLICK